ncbi:MAG: hypothetical protein ACJ72N_02820 [Labedaea sp.]
MSEQHVPGQPIEPGPVPEQILAQPVVMGDLGAELKQNKRSLNKVTLGLGGAVLLVAAFFGGVATHAAIAKPAQPAAQQAGNGRNGVGPFGGRNGGGGQNGTGQGQNGFRGTVGTIDHVDGTDVYLKTPDGRTVKVSTSDQTQVRISQPGKVSDLKQGENIIVQGSAGTDGTVSAQTITQQPARQAG